MSADSPVIVGVGQLVNRVRDLRDARSPLDLMTEAADLAAKDTGRPGILRHANSVQVVNILSWPTADPPGDLAAALGAPPGPRVYTTIGGDTPQRLVIETAQKLVAGDIRVALLAGAEAVHSFRMARARGEQLPWPARGQPTPNFGDTRPGANEMEARHGAYLPVRVYPLFENAIRAHRGWTLAEQRARLGRLGEQFSAIAARHPCAWFPVARSAAEVVTVTASNRMIAFPYPKFLNAVMEVDQAAAIIMTTESTANDLGIPRDRRVYLHGFGAANDHWFFSERANYYESPALAAAGRQAMTMAGVEVGEIALLDLYSCFPSAVQLARDALGIPEDDPRPLTVTGGLPYFGGAGNNYVMHSISTMVERLRAAPGTLGLVSGLGWFSTKHAVGIYSASAPSRPWEPSDLEAAQARLDAMPHASVAEAADGPATVETYTVVYNREGRPELTLIIGRLEDGRRFVANGPLDEDCVATLVEREAVGLRGRVSHDSATGINRFEW